jgi:hypothetical protein
MMGLPCLRLDGRIFASYDRRTGDLLVKLPAATVDQLVADGRAGTFAPAGRRFREWAAMPAVDSRSWPAMMEKAFAFVATDASCSAFRRGFPPQHGHPT